MKVMLCLFAVGAGLFDLAPAGSPYKAYGCLGTGLGILGVIVVWVIEERRWRFRLKRVMRGLCEKCGYNISECSGRCSECGHLLPEGHRTRSQIMEQLKKL